MRLLVDRSRATLEQANAHTLSAINRLSVVLAKENRFDEEVALLRAAVVEGKRALGSEPFVISDSLDNLAAALLHQGDLSGAEEVVRESLELNRRRHGENSPRVALAEYNLACVLARCGKNGEAVQLLESAIGHGLVRDAALQMSSDTDLAGLRDEPRFKALIAEVTKSQ